MKNKVLMFVKRNGRKVAFVCAAGAATMATTAQAQIDTNAPGVITGGIASAYNGAVAIGIGVIVVGMTVAFIIKGLSVKRR